MRNNTLALAMILSTAGALAACEAATSEEVGSAEGAAQIKKYKGTYGFIGSESGQLQELTLSDPSPGQVSPPGALAFGAYTAQVDVRVLDPAATCPVELAPCTYNDAGAWQVRDDGTGKQKLVLTPSNGDSARQYFSTAAVASGEQAVTKLRVGSADGPQLLLARRQGDSVIAAGAWGACNAGFHSALIEPGNSALPAGRDGVASIRRRCVPNIADCGVIDIDSRTELMITHPNVVRDPVRARNTVGPAGAWTLGRLIQDMIPAGNGVTPSSAFQAMLQSMTSATVDGVAFGNQPRSANAINALLNGLPKAADGVTIDMDRIHRTSVIPVPGQNNFELVAIAYRPDLQLPDADGPSKVGEARFVFTRSNSFTLINEYTLPVLKVGSESLSADQSKRIWALRFRALGTHAPFGESYRALLQRITNAFAGAGAKQVGVATPNGNSIAQIRTNDIELGSPWQIREYNLRHVDGAARLIPVTTKENPAQEVRVGSASFNGSALRAQLLGLIGANQTAILAGTFSIPSQFLGSSADTFSGPDYTAMFAGSGIAPNVQNAIVSNTCNGCHRNQTGTTPSHGFTHVQETSLTIANAANLDAGQDRLSQFVNTDMVNRSAVLRQILCAGQPAAPIAGQVAGRVHQSGSH